jgi:hypothetical protein
MKTYRVKISYQYESPYSGYSHNSSANFEISARSESFAIQKARKKAMKECQCIEYITKEEILS